MDVRVVFALLLVASTASAYTGICFLDWILGFLDSVASAIRGIVNPTTTTVPTTSTILETTTTTSTTVIITTTTALPTTTFATTSTTISTGKCTVTADCPPSKTTYKCNFDGNVEMRSEIPFCDEPGTPNSQCKYRSSKSREIDVCEKWQKCVEGQSQCVE